MRKLLPLLFSVMLVAAFITGCSSQNSTKALKNDDPPKTNNSSTSAIASDLSLDLTNFSPVEAFDVATNINKNPKEYLGTKIKVNGHYECANNNNTDGFVHGIVLDKEDLCCSPYFEFIWKGEHSYPEDYPEEYEDIQIEGILKSYKEGEQTYYYLDINEITKL